MADWSSCRKPIVSRPFSTSNPARGYNSGLAQYSNAHSNTPSRRVAGFEDDDDEDDFDASQSSTSTKIVAKVD
jgi:hypothetical protein